MSRYSIPFCQGCVLRHLRWKLTDILVYLKNNYFKGENNLYFLFQVDMRYVRTAIAYCVNPLDCR